MLSMSSTPQYTHKKPKNEPIQILDTRSKVRLVKPAVSTKD